MSQIVYSHYRDFYPALRAFAGEFADDYDLYGAADELLTYSDEFSGFIENGGDWVYALESHPTRAYYMRNKRGAFRKQSTFDILRGEKFIARGTTYCKSSTCYAVRLRDYEAGEIVAEYDLPKPPSEDLILETFAKVVARSLMA